MIRIQIAGGLGNQLFIWAGAHQLHLEFGKPVRLISTFNRNSREDRAIELEGLSTICQHDIAIESSIFYSFMLRAIDKLRLEDFGISRWALQQLGIYTFTNPSSRLVFKYSRPRFIRCYFQRTEIAEVSWKNWSCEIKKFLLDTDISQLHILNPSNVVHIRRGDLMSLRDSHGALKDEYFFRQFSCNRSTYICTDETHVSKAIINQLKPSSVFTPREANTWQTLKILCESTEFLGSNSTLSWWAAFIRVNTSQKISSLPRPWTSSDLGYDEPLNINGINYLKSEFLNA